MAEVKTLSKPRGVIRTLASPAVVILLAGVVGWYNSGPDSDTRMCIDSIKSATSLRDLVVETTRVAPAENGKAIRVQFTTIDSKGERHKSWWACQMSKQPGHPMAITETFPLPSR
jgi:hypothetical protein